MSHEMGLSAEEKVASLFQPDTLLPAQYFDTFRRKGQLEPEKRLMLAVLEDAIACFQKHVTAREGKSKVMFRDAEAWITEVDRDWLFSFDNVCEILGMDPQYLRQGLLRSKETMATARPKARIYRLKPKGRRRGSGRANGGRPRPALLKALGR